MMGFGSSAGMASALMGIMIYAGGSIASMPWAPATPATPVPMAALMCLLRTGGLAPSLLVRAGAGTAPPTG